MKLPWKIEKKVNTPAEQKLEEIKSLLFPALKLEEDFSEDGTPFKYHIDYSVDSNIDAVLIDLQEGHNDEVVQKTLNSVVRKLTEARRLLEAYAEIDHNAKYIIVDTGDRDVEVVGKEGDY